MNRLERIASMFVGLIVIFFLNEYDNLAIEHELHYGWLLRGVVWLIIAVLAIACYENIKTIFAKE